MQLRRAILFTEHIDRLTAFYRDTLGLTVLADRSSPGWVEFEGLALHALPEHGAKLPDPPPRRVDGWVKLVFHTHDVEGVRARLVASGVPMDEPFRWEGGIFCDGVDPEGNVFQISSRF